MTRDDGSIQRSLHVHVGSPGASVENSSTQAISVENSSIKVTGVTSLGNAARNKTIGRNKSGKDWKKLSKRAEMCKDKNKVILRN